MIIKKDIPDVEGLYKACSDGSIDILYKEYRSANGNTRVVNPKKLKHFIMPSGYIKVILNKDGNRYTRLMHRVIAVAFIENPENKKFVNHKNGIKSDNRVENLEWCTQSENELHAYRIGLKIGRSPNKGMFNERNNKSRPVKQLTITGNVIKQWPSLMEVKRELGFSCGNIGLCARGGAKTAYGFKWSYN